MKMLLVSLFSFLLLLLVPSVIPYPYGPPVSSCRSMFPVGHHADAMTSEPPYELIVSPGILSSLGQRFTVTLRVKPNPDYPYFEGVFVQARMVDCDVTSPVGSFEIPENDPFLKVMDCHSARPMSAVANKNKSHETSKTFTWIAPQSEPGHIYFRATVVKNINTFWTNVFSRTIQDVSDKRPFPSEPQCKVCQKYSTCTASSFSALASLVLAAFVMQAIFVF